MAAPFKAASRKQPVSESGDHPRSGEATDGQVRVRATKTAKKWDCAYNIFDLKST